MEDQKFREPLQVNNEPVNQLSKQAIKSLGSNPESEDLYWLQLLTLCLDRGLVSLPRPEFYQWLEEMNRLSPQELQNFLELNEEWGEERYPVVNGQEKLEPQELAELILERLVLNVQALNRGYVPVSDRPL
jgi:hypothetical protein